jgi:phage-related protein
VGLVKGIPGRITSGLGNIGSILYNAGASVIQGLISGITSKISAIKNTLSSVTNLIPDWKGPMDVDQKLLEPSGQAIMGGLDRGIRAGVDSVRSTLQGVTRSLPDMLGTGGPSLAMAGMPAVGSGSGAGTVNNWGDIAVTIPVADLEELRTVTDFFGRLEQEARRMAPGGVRRG